MVLESEFDEVLISLLFGEVLEYVKQTVMCCNSWLEGSVCRLGLFVLSGFNT